MRIKFQIFDQGKKADTFITKKRTINECMEELQEYLNKKGWCLKS